MAASTILFCSASRLPIVSSAASSNHRKPESGRRNNNWWTPIFGWPSEPDYLTGSGSKYESADPDPDLARPEKNLFTGCFTEEKAKALRKKTIETSIFHDRWNHSAIAARLASDLSADRDR